MDGFLSAYNSVIVFMAINGVLAYSMYAVLVAGQLSLAQAGFASIAAYLSALLTIHTGAPFLVVLVAGALAGGAVAALLGLPVLRLRGVFLAIATLGFGEMVRIAAINLGTITGGAQGLRSIPKVVGIPHAWLTLAAIAWFFARQRSTRVGRALSAVRQDEVAAASMGIDVVRHKMYAFMVSGAVAGISGVLFAHFARFIAPGNFDFTRTLDALIYAIVGGLGHWAGPIAGSSFVTTIPEVQRQFGFDQAWLRPALSGLALLLVILFLPEGLAGVLVRRGRRRATDDESVPDEGHTSRAKDVLRENVRPEGRTRSETEHENQRRPAVRLAGNAPTRGAATGLLVEISGLVKDYGGVRALDNVDLEVRHGEILGIIGPNGAGKTTLINVLSGVTAATSGSVVVAGVELGATTRAHRVAQLGVARTFQQTKLFDDLTVLDNVRVGAHRVSASTLLGKLAMLPSARDGDRREVADARSVLEFVGLERLATKPASALSYGDRRRLEIARALAGRPDLLVLDEPAAGMNHVEATRLGELMHQILDAGVTVLLIEHNVKLVMAASTRIAVLDFGRKIADGDPRTVASQPEVVEAYLGDETETPV